MPLSSTVSIEVRAEEGSTSLDADSEGSVVEFLVQACEAFGLEVDQIDTHCLLFSGTRLLLDSTMEENATETLKIFMERGGNHIDTSDVYGDGSTGGGESEKYM